MTNVLTDLSNALANTVASAGPGIVRVEGRRRLPATGFIWADDGVIVTAHHVVTRDDNISIGLDDGRSLSGALVGRDPSTDLAVLRVDAGKLAPITEANKQELGVGNFVLALGRPGKSVQATFGIISALGNSWRTHVGGEIDRYLQTDLVMYPGFSGGPLIDATGRLVGLNTSALSRGVSLAVPTPTISRVVESLLAHGRVRRGYVGVSTQRVRLPEALRGELNQKRGLLIISVEANSPAEQGGLTLGDTIVGAAGEAISNHQDLLTLLTSDRVGTAVPFKFIRGGQVQTLDVTIGERP